MKTEQRPKHKPIGEILIDEGLITSEQLKAALRYKLENGVKTGQALVALELVDETSLAKALRRQGKIHCVELSTGLIDPEVAMELGEEVSRRFPAVALNRIAEVTTVAMEDPGDVYSVDEIARQLGTKVLAVYAEPARIQECVDDVFARRSNKSGPGLDEIIYSEVDGSNSDVNFDVQAAEDDDEEEGLDGPIINVMRSMFEEAFEARASDIHLEPKRECLSVRFRVDGSLYERLTLPKGWARPCIARIKILAKLDIAQRRLPQDGRAQAEIHGYRVDLRVATTPTQLGEGAVIRILDGGRDQIDLDGLGFDPRQLEDLYSFMSFKEGFILATGPTGSGKTTTLYGVLQQLCRPDRKVITLEDPVENELEAATQINANPKIGLTFAAGLRSILRQDPDTVLVGEIRDSETAQIAVQAAQTGHLVLSTLHTVGSAEAVTRLADMGVEAYLLGDVMRGIIAQRLVRKLCVQCRQPAEPDPKLLARLGMEDDGHTFYKAVGCDHCREVGFKGRLGVYEVLRVTPELASSIRRGISTDDLVAAACEGGMKTLKQHAMSRARSGETTLDEVLGCANRG